ncbi:MAG: hypothetical protein K2P63_07410 [Lachnospiraceae bacterium]|nr:hypothetical protein [Lachnospiraceae bacterium]
MEDNNRFDTNTGDLGSGSLLYGTEPQPQADESGQSAAYGAGLTPQESAPARAVKPDAECGTQSEPAQQTEPAESATGLQQTEPAESA